MPDRSAPPEIDREAAGTKGRYFAAVDGQEAEMAYTITSPTMIIVDHTSVPDTARGKGLGLALAERLVSDARTEGVRVLALCPFVKGMAPRHPEWSDVIM